MATTKEANLAVYGYAPNPPGRPILEDVVGQIFSDTDPAGYPPIVNWNEVSDPIGLMFSTVVSGEKPGQEAADEACVTIDGLMRKAGYLK